MDWLTIFGVLFLTWMLWTGLSFYRNYRLARSTGLPIILSPVNVLTIPWMLVYRLTPVISYSHKLPEFLSKWIRYTYLGWQFDDAGSIHRELGPAFIVCSPGLNELTIADPGAAHSCLARRKEFIKAPVMYEPLNLFGRNLDTVEGEVWQRHRRLTAPNFNEKVSASVWSEAIRQSCQALEGWKAEVEGTTRLVDDTATVALHVLTSAGLGVQYEFKQASIKLASHHHLTYRDSLITILRNFFALTIVPMQQLDSWFMPKKLRQIGEACREFKLYMSEMVEAEKQAAAERKEEKGSLLSAMVRASESETHGQTEAGGRLGLTDDELFGNLFIYNLAGHETTANTVATAVAYLAANTEWQDWLGEEITHVIGKNSRPEDWSYEKSFPKLKRCLAVMYEALRIHGSIVFIPKETGSQPRLLEIAGKKHMIPAGTWVTINVHGIHSDSQIYANPQEWNPARWINTSNDGREELYEPAPGSFMPWADGPRICPGKKFAQVEFVAVMASLFQDHRVRTSPQGNDSPEESVEKLRETIKDSAITAITLQMTKPQDIKLCWTKQDG